MNLPRASLLLASFAALGLLLTGQQPSKEYIRLGGRVIAIQSGATVTPPPGPLPVDAGVTSEQVFSVSVTPADLAWSVTKTGDSALTLTNSTSFIGSQSVSFQWISANTSTSTDRTGTLEFRVAGTVLASVIVVQRKAASAGVPMLGTPAPVSASPDYCGVANGTFSIGVSGETQISAAANVAWVSGATIAGTGATRTATYSVLANDTTSSRPATITVTASNGAGSVSQGFSITQSGKPQLNVPTGVLVASSANAHSFPVSITVPAGNYSASSSLPSVASVPATFTGTGSPQTLTLQFTQNSTTVVRPVTITISTTGAACPVSAAFTVNQPGQPTTVPTRTISLSASGATLGSAASSSNSLTPTVLVSGVPQAGEYWMVTMVDSEAPLGFVTLLSGTAVPNTQARCGAGPLSYAVTQNTDSTIERREAQLSFFPMAEGTTCPGTARADTRQGPFNFVIGQLGPATIEATLTVTPSEFSGIPYAGANGLRTDVDANRYWDSVFAPSVFMRSAGFDPGSDPGWIGYVTSYALPNGTTAPRTDKLYINTANTAGGPGNYAQKVVYFHQNAGPPPTQAPTPSSISVVDPSNSGGARGRFTVLGTDLDGGADITQARLRIASNTSTNTACEVSAQKNGSGVYEFFLNNNSGVATGPLTIAAPSLSNSQCTLNLANSSVSIAGNTLSATFDIQFLLAFRGQPGPTTYNAYGRVKDATNVDSDWQLRAYQTVSGAAPQILSVSPSQGGPSSRQLFAFDLREPFGEPGLSSVLLNIPSTGGRDLPSCDIQYQPRDNPGSISLYRNDTATWDSQAISANMNLPSDLCTIRGVTYTPNALGALLTVDLEFAPSFGGSKLIRGTANNTYGLVNPYRNLGTWQVPEISTFTFSGPTGTVNATAGQLTSVNLAVTSVGGFNLPVSFQVSGLPAGANPTFTPNSVTGTQNATLRFTPTAGSYSVSIHATGGAIDKEVAFTVFVPGPVVTRSLELPLTPTGSANTDQLNGISRLMGLTDWRADTRVHTFSTNTSRTTVWSLWGTVPVFVDLDPATNRLRLISNWENLDDSRDCSVSLAGRTDILIRVQRANSGQYSLQVWNADGGSFAASTPANCTGTAGNQNINFRLAIGGDLYGQPGLKGGVAFWRLLSGVGGGAADPPVNTPPPALLAYEFEQQTLLESGGSSPAAPTLTFSYGIGNPAGTAAYMETPASGGGATPSLTVGMNPASVTVAAGASATSTTTVTANGFNGSVALTASGLPANVTASFNPATISGGSGTSVLTLTTTTGAAVTTSTVTVTGTSGSLSATANVSLTVTPARRSLILDGSGTANTKDLGTVARLAGLGNWRADIHIHEFASTTARKTLWSLWGSVLLRVDFDPVAGLLRFISNEGAAGVADGACSLAYGSRTELLFRVQRRSSDGQYSLHVWNPDGSNYQTVTCQGNAGNQNFDFRLAVGGGFYGQPEWTGRVGFWRLLSGLGGGSADWPTAATPAALLAYEFENSLTETGGGSPAGVTLHFSYGIDNPDGSAIYANSPN